MATEKETEMTHEEVTTYLNAHGWREYSSMGNEIWCKQYPGPRCKCNADKEGIQIVITVYTINARLSYEIELCAEKPDDYWVKLQVYGIGSNLLSVLDEQIRQLLRVWETIHSEAMPKP